MRDAFDTSVACTAPPVSFHSSHVSTVPKASPSRTPVSRRIHSSFVAEKYGSGVSPVRARIESAGSSRQRSAVRRSCQTIAGCTGSPDARSQTTVVSRWFAIPIASSCRRAEPRVRERGDLRRRSDARPQLVGILLDPARPRRREARPAHSRGPRPRARPRRRGTSCRSFPGRREDHTCIIYGDDGRAPGYASARSRRGRFESSIGGAR